MTTLTTHVARVEQFDDGTWDVACRCGWEALGYEDQETAEVVGREHQRSPEE